MDTLWHESLGSTISAWNDATYPRFADQMDKWGYDWEPVKVHTEDHYILTTFHILGKRDQEQPTEEPSRGSVLIQHGDFMDGTSWLENFTDSPPFQLQLVDSGYDVWIGSNRGTMYSWDHETLSSKDDDAYWLWTWAEMGLYDDVANIKMIKERVGVEKIFYVGYSQGTIQMHYGLAHLESDFHVDSLYKAVHLSPCFVEYISEEQRTPDTVTDRNIKMQELGVYAINGPNWDRDLVTICANFDAYTCWLYSSITGWQGQAVQSEMHWAMNAVENRFQEFDPVEDWLSGNYTTELVEVANIKQVPITFFTPTEDTVCPYATALEYIPKIRAPTERIDVVGEPHTYFNTANDEWFMTRLFAALQVPARVPKEDLAVQ